MKTPKKYSSKDYIKIVEWSGEDQCYVGSAPPLVGQCCHGKDEASVMKELIHIVDEWIELHEKDGTVLPDPSAGKEYSGKFVIRMESDLHKTLALKAMVAEESLNSYVVKKLRTG